MLIDNINGIKRMKKYNSGRVRVYTFNMHTEDCIGVSISRRDRYGSRVTAIVCRVELHRKHASRALCTLRLQLKETTNTEPLKYTMIV